VWFCYLGLTNNTTRAQRNAEDSALLRLPPEIRQRIWTYVVQAQIVHIGCWDPLDRNDNTEQSMIRVCRQVHAETCLLPYAVHCFRLYEDLWLKEWITRRLPEQTAAVQRVELWCDDCLTTPLGLLPGLCSLTVYCLCGECCGDDSAQGKIVEETLRHSCVNPDLKIKILEMITLY